jgi:hypothetical protein
MTSKKWFHIRDMDFCKMLLNPRKYPFILSVWKKSSLYYQGWKLCANHLSWISHQKLRACDLSIAWNGEMSPRRRKKCFCHCIQARYKKAQKRFEATFGNKKHQSSNRVLSAGDRWQAQSQRVYQWVCVCERERSAAGCVFVTPIDTLTDGFSKSMHQNSNRLE